MEDKVSRRICLSKMTEEERAGIFEDAFASPLPEKFFGYVPGYPTPSESFDRNPFNLIEGNENKTY